MRVTKPHDIRQGGAPRAHMEAHDPPFARPIWPHGARLRQPASSSSSETSPQRPCLGSECRVYKSSISAETSPQRPCGDAEIPHRPRHICERGPCWAKGQDMPSRGAETRAHPPDRCKVQETHAKDSLVSVVGGRQFARHLCSAARLNGPRAPGPSTSLRMRPARQAQTRASSRGACPRRRRAGRGMNATKPVPRMQ